MKKIISLLTILMSFSMMAKAEMAAGTYDLMQRGQVVGKIFVEEDSRNPDLTTEHQILYSTYVYPDPTWYPDPDKYPNPDFSPTPTGKNSRNAKTTSKTDPRIANATLIVVARDQYDDANDFLDNVRYDLGSIYVKKASAEIAPLPSP
jgi:hypothetical protein